MLGSTIACPYCYQSLNTRQIKFVCTGGPSRLGKPCTLRVDEDLLALRKILRELGPVFEPGGLHGGATNSARCPTCGSSSTYRICRFCHSQLPAQFGEISGRMIGMAGAKESGKTVYMTVLLHELFNRVGAQYDAAIYGADDETLRRFGSEYESPLYTDRNLLDATRPAAGGRVDPLVFRFIADRRGLRGTRPKQTLMSFFDTAGEDFESSDSIEVNTRYLAGADGIMLLIDPLQLPGARRLAAPGTRLPDLGYQSPANILSLVTSLLLKRNKRGKTEIDTPIAVVFTKLDALWHTLDEGTPLRKEPPTAGRFDTTDSHDVHVQIQHLLRSWEGVQIDQILRKHYPRNRFFAVSALGAGPTANNNVATTGIQPYRVADPVLWLLSEFGAVPKTREGR